MLKIKSLKIIHYPKSGTKIVRVRNCLKRRETMTTTTIVSMNFIWVYWRLPQLQKEARKVLNFSACVYWSVRSSGPDVVRQFVQMHPHARNMNHLAKWKCVSCRAIFGINRSHIAFYSTRTQFQLNYSTARNGIIRSQAQLHCLNFMKCNDWANKSARLLHSDCVSMDPSVAVGPFCLSQPFYSMSFLWKKGCWKMNLSLPVFVFLTDLLPRLRYYRQRGWSRGT